MMKRPSKKVFGLIVTIVIAIFVVAIVIVHQKHLQENKQKETKGVLYGVDVTDLSSHGVKNLDTDNDSKIYEKKLSDKEVDISSLGSEPYIEAIYHIQKLYQKDDIESLYNMINWEQMDQDGMGNVTEETFSRYLKDSFGNRNEARIFPLQTYKDKKAGYSIVGYVLPQKSLEVREMYFMIMILPVQSGLPYGTKGMILRLFHIV